MPSAMEVDEAVEARERGDVESNGHATGTDRRESGASSAGREQKTEESDEDEREQQDPTIDGDAVVDDDDDEEDEEEEEEALVVLELCDFKNHPVFDDYAGFTLEGIDTATPKLKIGEYVLHGQLEETVGTSFFYDTEDRTVSNEYRYMGQTVRKIKFTIEPPERFDYQLHR